MIILFKMHFTDWKSNLLCHRSCDTPGKLFEWKWRKSKFDGYIMGYSSSCSKFQCFAESYNIHVPDWVEKWIKWLSFSFFLFAFQKGLSFLINDCNLIHNNVCLSSVFVNQAGEWKLGGVDYMYPAQGQDSVPPVKILPLLDKYDPPEKVENRRGVRTEKW